MTGEVVLSLVDSSALGIRINNASYFINLTEHFIGDASNNNLTEYAIRVVEEVASVRNHGDFHRFVGILASPLSFLRGFAGRVSGALSTFSLPRLDRRWSI